MSQSPSQPRVLIVAFQGWSDAGDATTEVLQHLGSLMGSEVLHVIGAEGYVDFQVHRPKVLFDEDGNRVIEWPDTRLYGNVERPGAAAEAEIAEEIEAAAASGAEAGAEAGSADDDREASSAESDGDAAPAEPVQGSPDRSKQDPNAELVRRIDGTPVTDLFLLAGVEPARDWQNFADEIVELVDVWAIDSVIILGAMYSDSPHSRPIATTISSESPELREATGAKRANYEGPAGIATVVDLALTEAGLPPISLWAQVPHYVHSTPSPKATLALLDKLEELLDIVIPRGELLAQANEWEANINRIAAADEEMTRYIRRLEESRDEAMAAESTGDAIALEFEKFLEGGIRRDAPKPQAEERAEGRTEARPDAAANEDTDPTPDGDADPEPDPDREQDPKQDQGPDRESDPGRAPGRGPDADGPDGPEGPEPRVP